ncbi:MAG: hypothetical protein MK066_01460 [Crocinitomicaceae bacterium]|nr:hypothetical protein [Crocinitomicaceae bacterium]
MKNIITIIFVVITSVSFGQDVDHTLHGTGQRHVEPAYRIATSPTIIDTVIPTPMVKYPLLVLKYETETEVEMINPASIKTTENLSQLYNTYIKMGVSTEFMPIGEVYFDAKRSRKYLYGAHLKHLSSFGDIRGFAPAQFDRTRFNTYGAINERKYTLRGDIHYNNQGLHYYGISDTLGLSKDSIAQRYSDFGMEASFFGHKKDSANINYIVGVEYNNFSSKKPLTEGRDDWRASENFFGISSSAWYKLGEEVYAADFDIHYNGYKYGVADSIYSNVQDSGIVMNNTIVSLRPHITTRLMNNRFKAKVGLNFTINSHNITQAHIYPLAELKYSMFNDIFIPYVGLRGGMKQNTFKNLSSINEFILPNVNMLNENKAIDFYGGIKGTLSKQISFNAGISFANVKNRAMFVTDTTFSIGNKFNVIFDTMNITTIDGSISYQLKEKLKVDAIARFYSYNVLNNSYAWNLPNLEVTLRGSYNLFDKFLFNLDLNVEQGRRALVYAPGTDVTLENGQYIQKLNFITDVNLGVEYRYNQRISAFVQFNNIASQRYARWYNTPVHAFQAVGGVTFRL